MNLSCHFRNITPSEAVKTFAEEKLGKLQKMLHASTDVLEAELHVGLDGPLHRADLTLKVDGKHYVAHDESSDLYHSIGVAVDRVHRQIRDAKEAQMHRKRHSEVT